MRHKTLSATGAVLLVFAAGCAPDAPPAASPDPVTSSTPPPAATSPAPGGAEVSPGGVTTAVDAPAESTEDDYFQACLAARAWMDQRGGDAASQIEPYLKTLQDTDSAGPGTFGTPWSGLSPGQQSAVIVAVEAAAGALCG